MNAFVHKADTRGAADHGWLKAKHSFSFAGWFDPTRIQFGALRVLNDDLVAGGQGFGTHPHDNMEIITIPLKGAIAHKDSMGNTATVKAGEIQVMSAGTGIQHSEFNPSPSEELNLLQIWLFPNRRNVEPRYDQQALDTAKMHNNWLQVLSPDKDDDGVWIHQDAWFHLGEFDAGVESSYKLKNTADGLYVFVISGEVSVNGEKLDARDAMGITGAEEVSFAFGSNAKVLLMEVPMNL
jgi:quercetin 2,3-dioxygenase